MSTIAGAEPTLGDDPVDRASAEPLDDASLTPDLVALAYRSTYGFDKTPPVAIPRTIAMPDDVEVLYSTDAFGASALRPENDPALERVDDLLAVRAFVRDLPTPERRVVFGLYWELKTQAELAEEMSVHASTVSRLHERALARGREVMAGAYMIAA